MFPGPYDPNLIVTLANRDAVIRDLRVRDWPAAALVVASNVELANMYHGGGMAQSPASPQHVAAQAVLDAMAALSGGAAMDEELIRYLARAEAQALIDAQQPHRIEVVSQAGTVILDGPLHYRTPLVIRIVAIGHAVMLVGPAGCGKTTIGEHVAQALQLSLYITSTITDTHELLGFVDGYGKYHTTPFRVAFECGGLWIADELDAWDANALLAANSALANGFASFPDSTSPVRQHPEFRMVATANTFGTGADRVYVGRNELDAASLDRLAMVDVDYDVNLERMFANGSDEWLDRVWRVRKMINDKRIRHVASTRAIRMGAAALAAGLSWEDVENIYLFKGMSQRDRDQIDD